MDNELHELEDSQDWGKSRMLVFFILRQLNEKVKELENQQTATNIKLATWGTIGGLIGGFIPMLVDLIRQSPR